LPGSNTIRERKNLGTPSHRSIADGMMPSLPIDVAIGRSKRRGRTMREALQASVKRVDERAEHVRGNEPATRPSPVGPPFTIPGNDRTAPRECISKYRVDFGPNRSVKSADRKVVRASATNEWVLQRALTAVLDNPARSELWADGEVVAGGHVETTQE